LTCRSGKPGGVRSFWGASCSVTAPFGGGIAFFRDLLDGPLSLGSVHAIVCQAVRLAQPLNAAPHLARGRAASHDDLFQAGQPVWAGLDLESTDGDRLAPEAYRDAETWGIHEQGLHPDDTGADGGHGLRAGQALAQALRCLATARWVTACRHSPL
jgi:hypothetical protein